MGTCCGMTISKYHDYGGPADKVCELYHSDEGEENIEYWGEEIYASSVTFYSARPVEEGRGRRDGEEEEGGIMEQASMWFEDAFGSSSAQKMAATITLVAAVAISCV